MLNLLTIIPYGISTAQFSIDSITKLSVTKSEAYNLQAYNVITKITLKYPPF